MKKSRLFVLVAAMLSCLVSAFAQSDDGSRKYVALSFDDGPNREITPRMLEVLKENNVKASFFVIGSNVDRKTAPLLRKMVRMGCDVMNHTFTHPDLTKITDEEILREIAMTDSVIIRWTGVRPSMVRPPYTAFNKHVADVIDGKTFIAGLSVGDWQAAMPTDEKVSKVLDRVKDGDILLFHDTNETTLEAVKILIPALENLGYEICSVKELFQHQGLVPPPHTPRMYSNVL